MEKKNLRNRLISCGDIVKYFLCFFLSPHGIFCHISTAIIALEADEPVDEDVELIGFSEEEHASGFETVTVVYTELVSEQALNTSDFH